MIVDLTLADALHVIAYMRETDRAAMVAKFPGMSRERYAMERFMASDYRYALIARDGEPVAIGGAQFATHGVGTLWLIATDRINGQRVELVRFARKFVRTLLAQKLAHRLQGYVLSELEFCRRFAELFGFQREATIRAWGANGEDIDIYGLVG